MAEAIALSAPRRSIPAAILGAWAAFAALAPSPWIAGALAAPLAGVALAWWLTGDSTRWLSVFFFAALVLPPLPIRLGDSGPHIAIAFAALGVVIGLARIAEWRFRVGMLDGALVLYLGILFAGAPIAALYSGVQISLATFARVLLSAIAIYVFFYTAYGPRPREYTVKLLFWCGVVSAAFGCIDFYYQLPAPAGFGPQFVWLASGVFRRAQGVFYEATVLGNMCVFFLVMIAAALLGPRKVRPVPLPALLAGGVIFGGALIFSFSRSSLIALSAATAVLAFFHRSRLRPARIAAIAGILIATVTCAMFALPQFAEAYFGRLRGTFQYIFTATGSVLSGRADTWYELSQFLRDHPLWTIVGVGYKTLPYSSIAGHPLIIDNMYLSMLAETGIIGLAVLLLLNIAILRAAYRAVRHPNPQTAFLGTWIFAFWLGQLLQMLSGDVLTYWRVLPVYLFVLALAVRQCHEHPVR